MSEIELGNLMIFKKVKGWKIRANNAGLDYYWVCKITNNAQKRWSAL